MTLYFWLKVVHILSATLIFGTGLGSAFVMWRADRSRDVAAIAFAARHVVVADWLFTTPAILVQPITGAWLAWSLGYSLTEGWIALSLALYIVAGACWLPVVWLQIRMRDLAVAAREAGAPLPPAYSRFMRLWFALGWPAFLAVIAIFWLMVFKPAL